MYIIYITGTAGSGKSLFAKTLNEMLSKNGWESGILNTDAATASLPYDPVSDIRDYIDIRTIEAEYKLGSNGSMIFAADLLATFIPRIQEDVDVRQLDYLIVDTAGQMELFAYRESGKFLLENLIGESKMLIFLSDPFMMSTPFNFLSIKILALSIMIRFNMYSIHILNKIDLDVVKANRVIKWDRSTAAIQLELSDNEQTRSYMKFYKDLRKSHLMKNMMPISALTGKGMEEIIGVLANQFTFGEEFKQ